MFGPKELDLRNTYEPNLEDIQESSEVEYLYSESLLEEQELYLKYIEEMIEQEKLIDEKRIRSKCYLLTSNLAFCCEGFLKALFLYENINSGKTCKELWTILETKNKQDKIKKDKNGNAIYYQTEKDNKTPLKYENGTIVYTYAKVDSDGNLIYGEDGNPIYVDKLGREYSYNRKGNAAIANGHEIDRLISILSNESQLLLENRVLTIPMETTEENEKVTIIDMLCNRGILEIEKLMTDEEYNSWLEKHKKAFEEARYPGQKNINVSVSFMHHLTTQIKALVQYRMFPSEEQIFEIDDKDYERLPSDLKNLLSYNNNLISKKIIELVLNNKEIAERINKIPKEVYMSLTNINNKEFYDIINKLESSEFNIVIMILYLNILVERKEELNYKKIEKIEKYKRIIDVLELLNIDNNIFVKLILDLKKTSSEKIDIRLFDKYSLMYLKMLKYDKYYTKYISANIENKSEKDNFFNEKNNFINNIKK